MPKPQPQEALHGLKVIDLSRVLAGPSCTQILADHGADVIKVEPPGGDETRGLGPPFTPDGTAAYFGGLNRNKRTIALDLRAPAGREVLIRLLENADVLVENFLPGTMEKWGLGYEEKLAQRFPRLVYCSISGFGRDGPLGGRPGYDAVLQALCGLMSVNGFEETGATRIGIPIVDLATGLQATITILLALAERGRSGRGQQTETTLFDTAFTLMHPHAANWLVSGAAPKLTGNAHPNISPYDTYQTADGMLFLGIVNDAQFRRFCDVVGEENLARDPRFSSNQSRLANRPALRAAIEALLRSEHLEAICERLMAAGVPAGAVRPVPEALDDPHAKHRGMIVELGQYRGIGAAQKLARTPATVRSAPPAFAADTRSLLAENGYSPAEIEALILKGVTPLHLGGNKDATVKEAL
jgi:crotonobetainyl-CoA:carnitine CoA-transferase CaiB-like acyl-CoA transferase